MTFETLYVHIHYTPAVDIRGTPAVTGDGKQKFIPSVGQFTVKEANLPANAIPCPVHEFNRLVVLNGMVTDAFLAIP